MVVNISKRIKRELFKKQSYTDNGVEEEGVYKVTLVYSVKWQKPMRSLQLSKLSSRYSRKATEHAGQRGVRENGWAGLKTGASNSVVISDIGTDQDLIDLIDEDEDLVIDGEVTKRLVPDLDSDSNSCSSLDSITSGPSLLRPANSPVSPPQGLCAGCVRLYREASKKRGRPQNSVHDNDPSSLSCDQWVLQKKWRPRRLPNIKGRLWTHIRLIREGITNEKPNAGQSQQPACWRPLVILQRNLKRCVRQVAAKGRKKTVKRCRKKRSRGAGHGPQVTKKQRLDNNSCHSGSPDDNPAHCSSFHSDPGLVSEGKRKDLKRGRRALKFELSPSVVMDCPEVATVSMPKHTMPKHTMPKQTMPKQIMPKQTMPKHTMPKQTMPKQIMPKQTMPKHTMPKQTMPKQTMPKQTMPKQIMPKQIMPKQIMPKQIMPKQIMPKQTMPKQTMPKRDGFRDLLAQLRGQGSAIVKESHT